MDPLDLAPDTIDPVAVAGDVATASIDAGAALAVASPDIPIDVAPSSFDSGLNYQQATVTAPFQPMGSPVNFTGPDGTISGSLNNALCFPTSSEDAIAYSASSFSEPPYTDTTAPTDFTNTSNGPVDSTSAGTQSVNPAAAANNAPMHGISDAISGLVKPITGLFARNTSATTRSITPTLAGQTQSGGPMAPGVASGPGTTGINAPGTTAPAQADQTISAETVALGIGALALVFFAATT